MFITFEGPDGSGKTTIINRLINELIKKYPKLALNYVLTREPGGKDIIEAEKIRSLILDKESNLSPVAEALLYTTSRRIHLERVIWPALKENKLVLCDRYVDSFYAYQGYARNLGFDFVRDLTNLIIDKTMPDITIFFEIKPVESRIRREQIRIISDRLDSETEHFHQSVYDGYHQLIKSEKERFIVVNASKSIEEVLDETLNKLIKHSKFKAWIKEFK
ncbi:dTMP kinase [Mycoplasmopsis caviae]|uniref:Thymidylate kinase n=1 Tax=Mycoplasmopsis caviae TaxID=55603 RepID=A0A3P8KM19_9BACT|nr:dTMP kinase [Mycoplasmopsis caviae]UUD35395.1 dTMP kinase [Mycoplasmopsis caviae]VDR41828.1 Thymidylate kinase [Mycoplasmopsis caviae]